MTTRPYPTIDTQSDDKNNSNYTIQVSSSEKESKEYQSSSNSRKTKTNRKISSIYDDRTLENLRNIYKAEKELRGIF